MPRMLAIAYGSMLSGHVVSTMMTPKVMMMMIRSALSRYVRK
jgi:hypothetical protein